MIKFKRGDVVTMRGLVIYIHDDGEVCVQVHSRHGPIYLKPEHLTLVHHEFKVGDRVSDLGDIGTVHAIYGERAQIEMDSGRFRSAALSKMEHAPPVSDEVPSEL
jgi:hypothetical protein